ncbi:hypothetical protein EVAR_37934_1 [Eumeta japonica]|uniref:Uncharacterized protein n=1 Tax=Eumeta variegata TaxID=151549 RepID=A0A4C1XDY8_EUMVA|nr:hypothetical protein EVAR_37934_1 [Eumeta japonica]
MSDKTSQSDVKRKALVSKVRSALDRPVAQRKSGSNVERALWHFSEIGFSPRQNLASLYVHQKRTNRNTSKRRVRVHGSLLRHGQRYASRRAERAGARRIRPVNPCGYQSKLCR